MSSYTAVGCSGPPGNPHAPHEGRIWGLGSWTCPACRRRITLDLDPELVVVSFEDVDPGVPP